MNNLTTFYIVRHGETDWNVQKKLQGQTDIPLNDMGINQAKELAKEIKHIHFDEIISSDLLRARKTAEIIALERDLEVKTTQILRERMYGKMEGMTRNEMHELYKNWKELTEKEKWGHKIVNEETLEEASIRFITYLRETAIANPSKNILIVCHGGLMRPFLVKLGYGDFETIGGFDNCGYIHVESDGVDFFIKNVKGVKEYNRYATK